MMGDEFGLPEETEGSFVGRVGAGGGGEGFLSDLSWEGVGKS